MIHASRTLPRASRRLARVALTALVLGLGAVAISAVPLADLAFAGNGNGKGGGNGGGKGGGNGGGKGGGNGGGHGHGGGGNGGGGQGNAGGHGKAGDQGKSGKSARSGDADTAGDGASTSGNPVADDGSLAANKLGKLNGFFHASPNALANASPNSAIGRISRTFRDALSDFAKAAGTEPDPDNPDATPPSGPSVDDLGAILAGATNKPVTAMQVQSIIERLAAQNPDDAALNDLADSPDEATAQDIADAANAVKAGEAGADDDTASTPSDDRASDDPAVARTATN
jgi:hypothetical protein